MHRKREPEYPASPPDESAAVPPIDPDALAEAARRMLRKPKPPGGWGKSEKPKREGDGK